LKIKINQLALKTTIGVYEWERQSLMTILADVSIEITYDDIKDNIDDTVNYFSLSQALINRAEQCEYQLLEALIVDLRNVIINFDDRIQAFNIRLIKKGILKEAESTSVELAWNKYDK
jgi:FolB domain-containing protein